METATPGPKKLAELSARLASLGIDEALLVETFVQGFGPGGQKINKTASCVSLPSPPLDIRIKCQRTRSRALNRYYARVELCERVAERIEGERSRRQQEAEKIRRQKRRRSRRAKAKMLADKHAQSEKKALRRRPAADD